MRILSKFVFILSLLFATDAFAVSQSGTVTVGHCAEWSANQTIADSGSPCGGGGGSATWGGITGTLSDQTDLQSALDAKVPTSRTISTTSPLAGGGDLSADRTLSIANAVADGSTKGAASFTAADFDSSSGNISLDYANGQKATSLVSGFLSSTDWAIFNAKQTAGNYLTALTGDGTASGPGSAALTLATVNTNVGSFGSSTSIPSLTVNGKGLITAISGNAVIAPAGTLTGSTLASGVTTSSLTSLGVQAAALNMGSHLINNVTDPISAQDAATKAYVDLAVLGQDFKEACKYASTAALPTVVYNNGSSGVGATLTAVGLGGLSLDGNTPSVNDRVLIKNQASTFQNGIYNVTAVGSGAAVFVMTRAIDFNQSGEIKTGASTFITAGSTQSVTTWAMNAADFPVMGTDAITFAQIAGQGAFLAGNGITITGMSIAIDTSVTVDKTTAQTLTNKTLTSPILTTPDIGAASGSGLTLTGLTASRPVITDSGKALASGSYSGNTTTFGTTTGTLTSGSLAKFDSSGNIIAAAIIPGTLTDGKTCTYTSSGTALNCTTTLTTGTVTSIATSNGITGGTITSTGTISGVNAAADGSTKGVAAFNANDFNAATGLITLDYTNAQKATSGQPGFLTSTDWTTFNNKVATTRAINTTAPLSGGGDLSADRTLTTSMATNKLIGRGTAGTGIMEEITLGTGLSLSGTTLNAPGAISSVSNSDSTLTISPTTGAVVASINLANPNVWTGKQTMGAALSLGIIDYDLGAISTTNTQISLLVSENQAASLGSGYLIEALSNTGAAALQLDDTGFLQTGGVIEAGTTFKAASCSSAVTPCYHDLGTTGIYFPGGSAVGFVNSGSEIARINNGIKFNTTNNDYMINAYNATPTINLHDTAGGTDLKDFMMRSNAGDLIFYKVTDDHLTETELVRFFNTGKVGIGTSTSGGAMLDVVSGTNYITSRSTTSNTQGGFRAWNNQNSSVRSLDMFYTGSTYNGGEMANVTGEAGMITTTGSFPLYLGASSNADITILSSHKVGIGQPVPVTQLDVLQGTVGNAVMSIASAATNDDPTELLYQGRLATTDATQTTINTFTLASSAITEFDCAVTARRTGGSSGTAEDGAGYKIQGTYKKVSGTTATLIGAVNAAYTAESQSAWDATFTVSSGNVLLRVTGAANNNVTWHSTCRMYQVGT